MEMLRISYNYHTHTSIHSSIGTTPYYAMWGYDPKHSLDLPEVLVEKGQHKALENFVKHQQQVLVEVRDALKSAQMTMEEYSNRRSNGKMT